MLLHRNAIASIREAKSLPEQSWTTRKKKRNGSMRSISLQQKTDIEQLVLLLEDGQRQNGLSNWHVLIVGTGGTLARPMG